MIDYAEDPEVVDLRRRLRALVREQIPASFLGAFTDDPGDFQVTEAFCRVLGAERLLTPAWPVEYGGNGASLWVQTAVREEMWSHHEPRGAQYMGVNWVGPTLMRHGTADQLERHLPPISAGSAIWCQGFSEPGAGSDLPALRTSATKADGGWRINGQKVWTSYARMAQWCFLLARTAASAERRHGITVFLLRMDQPGVQVRPIASMLGAHHLNEVFFDDAWVPDEDVLGEVDQGWSIVREVIAFERVGIARYARCERLLKEAPEHLGNRWGELPAALRARWARALMHTRRARLLAYKVIDLQTRMAFDAASTAAYRIAVTQLDQEVAEVLMDIVGEWALGAPADSDVYVRAVEDHWRYAQASTVASGTLEMQQQALAAAMGLA